MSTRRVLKTRSQPSAKVEDLEPVLQCVRRALLGDKAQQGCHPDYFLRLTTDASLGTFPENIKKVIWRQITFSGAFEGRRGMEGFREIVGGIELTNGTFLYFNWREGPGCARIHANQSTDQSLLEAVMNSKIKEKYLDITEPPPSDLTREQEETLARSQRNKERLLQDFASEHSSAVSGDEVEGWGGAERQMTVAEVLGISLIRQCDAGCGRNVSVSGEDRCARCMNNHILVLDIEHILKSGADADSMERSIQELLTLHMNTHRKLDDRDRAAAAAAATAAPIKHYSDLTDEEKEARCEGAEDIWKHACKDWR